MATDSLWSRYFKRRGRSLSRPAFVVAAAALLSVGGVHSGRAAADPVVSVVPESPAIPVDAVSFQVDVFVAEVTNTTGLGSYDLLLHFDPLIIHATGVTDSGFVLSAGNIVVCVPPEIDNAAGLAVLSCVTIPVFVGNGPTTTAPQLLATAVFQPVSPGTSVLSLDGTALSDPFGAPLDVTLQNSQVFIAPPPSPTPEPATLTPMPTAAFTPAPTATQPPTATPAALPTSTSSPVPAATEVPTATVAPAGATSTVTAPLAPTQAPPPTTPHDPGRTLEPDAAAAPSPPPTSAPLERTVTPAAGPVLPSTGNGPGDGGTWVLPVILGLAGAVAASFVAGVGVRTWRRRRGRPAARL